MPQQLIHFCQKKEKKMAARLNIQDALSAIRQRGTSPVSVYGASINADGSITITHNGTALPNKFWWNIQGVPQERTDSNQGSNDSITIEDSDGSNARVGDFQNFLNSLL